MSLLALLAAAGTSTPVDPDPGEGWSVGAPGDPVWVPPGSMDAWRAARDNAANELVEVVYYGDSTGYGQTAPSGPPVPPPWLLRDLSIAAGHADGGYGIYGTTNTSTAPAVGPNHAGILDTDIELRNVWDGNDMMQTTQWQHRGTPGAWVTFQGRAPLARIWVTSVGGIEPTWSYRVDGGAVVQVGQDAGEDWHYSTLVDLGSDGLHEITVVNTSTGLPQYADDLRVVIDWIRPTGIVWHRACVPGIRARFAAASLLRAHLGLTQSDQPQADHPRWRRPRLALWGLGINDQQNQADPYGVDVKPYLDDFITKARAAGASPVILVNHFEGAGQTHLADDYRAMHYAAAVEHQCALVDIGSGGALGDPAQWVANGYISNMGDPHLKPLGYQTQAEYLWDNCLSL